MQLKTEKKMLIKFVGGLLFMWAITYAVGGSILSCVPASGGPACVVRPSFYIVAVAGALGLTLLLAKIE